MDDMTESVLQAIKRNLHYDSIAGIFTWIISNSNRVNVGDVAGYTTNDGYVQIRVNRKLYMAHRLAFLYMTGGFPIEEIDHINGLRNDNRWINIREATRLENCQNTPIQKNNTSGFTGVVWDKKNKNWMSRITVNGKTINIGRFDNPHDAYKSYLSKKSEVHTFQPDPRSIIQESVC